IDRLTDQLFIFEGDGNIKIYSGNYTDYRLEQENLKTPSKETIKPDSTKKEISAKKSGLSYKEEKELNNLEETIEDLEKEIEGLILKLNSGITSHEELSKLALMI